MRWVNVALALGAGLMLPVYRHMYRTHQLVQTAESTGVWTQIPTMILTHAEYIEALQKQAQILLLKLKIQDATITIEASDPLSIYTFLHRMNKIPALHIESFTMKREKGKVIATIKMTHVIPEGRTAVCPGPQAALHTKNSFYNPRFFYVNAATEVDGQKQIWVNGKSYGPSCPWPLYHTFDRRTGTVKKGDLRPTLSLLSLTSAT